MNLPLPAATSPLLEVFCPSFLDWLQGQQFSLALTTYQSSRLILLGVNSEGRLSGFERIFDRAMGLYATPERLYLSSKYQVWQLDNVLSPGQLYEGYDKLYVPRLGHTTGDLDIHDLTVDRTGQLVFVSTLLNCLATVSQRHSCLPLWKPPFISQIVNEDRCHLNGLAMVEGEPGYVTAVSQSDVVDGWRGGRRDGGCVIDVQANEVILTQLSMPHSPRWYRGKLWLLNSGTGEFGFVDIDAGRFEPIAFCPGYMRGLAFWDDLAIVGLSKPRGGDKNFSGLALDDNLTARNIEPRCGLVAVDLKTGKIVHWLEFTGAIAELYDVQVLPHVRRPMALGFQTEEIAQLITIEQPVALSHTPTNGHVPTNGHAKAHFNRGRELKQHDLDAAAACFRQAIGLQPDYAEAHNNLGTILQTQGFLEKAVVCYQQALQIYPDSALVHSNLASVQQVRGDLEQAEAGYQQVLRLEPNYVFAYYNLGNLYRNQGRLEAAIACFQRVLELQPNYADAYSALGAIFDYLGNLEAALTCYGRVQALKPEDAYLFSYMRFKLCDWQDYDERVQEFMCSTAAHISRNPIPQLTPYTLSCFPTPIALHAAVARHYARHISQSVAAAKASCAFVHPRSVPERLRIGYVSPDFREHAVGILVHQMFGLHDRTRFEVYAYSLFAAEDDYTRRIREGCDVFRDISRLSPLAAAQQIYADGIHILIDMAGYTIYSRPEIFALQPAPIQAQFLGYPDTMGADFMQYAIADAWLIPPELATIYTEEIVYLPQAFIASPLEISDRQMTRAEFGLPEAAVVFCCFNAHYKIDPDVFALWMRILRQVPNSVLWLSEGTEVTSNLRTAAAGLLVEPERLVFAKKLPMPEYLAQYRLADLFLDTSIYSAGSTAICALWAGVPLLTLPGNTNASRMGASICAAAGLESMICQSVAQYEQRAVYLATHPEELSAMRHQLETRTAPLFQLQQQVQNLELAFHKMWTAYLHNA